MIKNPEAHETNIPLLIQEIKKRMKKAEIARVLKVTWATVNLWERGTFKPSAKFLTKLNRLKDGYN